MGVSLERVQFKFASIIGELCSEPDILSQFAVWLDLRLAEYKLKGAISLDCSGEEPDPIWMKGLRRNKQRTVNSPTSRSRSAYRSGHQTPVSDSPHSYSEVVPNMDIEHRLSPEVVVVKEEPDVYPVNMVSVSNLKRTACDSSGELGEQPSPSKHRRILPTESPSNQSLMSVIGGFNDETQESDIRGDNSIQNLSPSASRTQTPPADLQVVGQSGNTCSSLDNILNDTVSDMSGEPSTSQDFGSKTERTSTGHAGEAAMTNSSSGRTEQLGHTPHQNSIQTWHSYFSTCSEDNARAWKSDHELKTERSNRISHKFGMSKGRLCNVTSAVGLFERWLWDKYAEEWRGIHQISPQKLDPYLAEFFTELRQPNGSNYSHSSFKSLRSNLDFYLKCTGYPFSIANSEEFSQSQTAYKSRAAELKIHTALSGSSFDLAQCQSE